MSTRDQARHKQVKTETSLIWVIIIQMTPLNIHITSTDKKENIGSIWETKAQGRDAT